MTEQNENKAVLKPLNISRISWKRRSHGKINMLWQEWQCHVVEMLSYQTDKLLPWLFRIYHVTIKHHKIR